MQNYYLLLKKKRKFHYQNKYILIIYRLLHLKIQIINLNIKVTFKNFIIINIFDIFLSNNYQYVKFMVTNNKIILKLKIAYNLDNQIAIILIGFRDYYHHLILILFK